MFTNVTLDFKICPVYVLYIFFINKILQSTGLKATMEEGGKFFDLPGAEKGKVIVRFPPEASG